MDIFIIQNGAGFAVLQKRGLTTTDRYNFKHTRCPHTANMVILKILYDIQRRKEVTGDPEKRADRTNKASKKGTTTL